MLKHELLKHLCDDFFSTYPEEQHTSIYYLLPDKEKQVEEGQINRIRGNSLRLKPSKELEFLEENNDQHVFTLDLRSMPKIKKFVGNNRALAFFSNQEENSFRKVLISEDEILEITSTKFSYGFDIIEINVPYNVFNYSNITDHYLETNEEAAEHFFDTGEFVCKDVFINKLTEIEHILYSAPAYVLGRPMYIQDEYEYSDFLMQFDGRFGNMGLGDAGVMYVFMDREFFQTH